MDFVHRGARGDIIYSLATVKAMGGGNFYFRKKSMFIDLKKIVEQQSYINEVAFKGSDVDINLDLYLDDKDLYRKNLAQTFLDTFNITYDLTEPWLDNIEEQRIAQIVIQRSKNYHDKEEINWQLLKPYKDQILFIGFEPDFDAFCRIAEFIPKRKVFADVLDLAEIIKGSDLFIGNQSIGFAVAEAMKHPRVLEICYKKDNCRPSGKNAYTYLTPDIIKQYVQGYLLNKLPIFRSKFGQDEWVLRMLKNKKNGYFVDIGASNGVSRNDTYVLEKDYNWRGICVEPHSKTFPILKKNRSCICDNHCIAGQEGPVDFLENKHHPMESGIAHSETDECLLKQKIKPQKIQAITLMDLLEIHDAPHEIDYLNIDVEGAEWLMLENFDFNKYNILLMTIHIDCPGKTYDLYPLYRDKRVRVKKVISRHGYHRTLLLGNNDFYVKKNNGFEILI